jgi:hypothetical protein
MTSCLVGSVLCIRDWLPRGVLVLAAGRGQRRRVRDTLRDGLQASRHDGEGPSDVALDPCTDRLVAGAEDRALGDAAAGDYRQHADGACQRNPEHAVERRVHIDDLT